MSELLRTMIPDHPTQADPSVKVIGFTGGSVSEFRVLSAMNTVPRVDPDALRNAYVPFKSKVDIRWLAEHFDIK